MASVVIRKLPDETLAALKKRAKAKGWSTEAEIRDLLEKASRDAPPVGLGTALHNLWKTTGLTEPLEIPPRKAPTIAMKQRVDFSGPEFDHGDDHT